MTILVEHEKPRYSSFGHEFTHAVERTVRRHGLHRSRQHVLHNRLGRETILSDYAQGDVPIGDHAERLSIGAADRQQSHVVEGHHFGGTRDSFAGPDPLDVMTHDFSALHVLAPIRFWFYARNGPPAKAGEQVPPIPFPAGWLNQVDVLTHSIRRS